MKPIILILIMLFTYLLINHFYYVHEGLANAESSPTPSTQMYVNENNIKNSTTLFKKIEKEINDQLNAFMKHLKKSQAQSKQNGQN